MLKSSQFDISFAKHVLAIIFLAVFVSCDKEEEIDFTASFSYDFIDDNNVKFTNTSEGEYYSVEWDFGNGETVETTDRSKTYTVNYPQAGDYTVSLSVLDFAGNVKTDEQTVTITTNGPNYIPDSENLIWSDEFNGAGINSTNWTFETGASGWGNNELQNYTNGDNVEVKDGKLVITTKKVNNNQAIGSYTSARMITKDKQEFIYGKIEIRAKLPSGRGIWPAIWMLGANFDTAGWPACGEIDIMEYVGYQPNTIYSTVHTPAGFGGEGDGSGKTLETAEEEFHVYGLIWNENELIFYTDDPDNVTHTYSPANKNGENWPFSKPQFFIFNIAVGGDWGGREGIDDSIFPQTMEIDYVRVYRLDN